MLIISSAVSYNSPFIQCPPTVRRITNENYKLPNAKQCSSSSALSLFVELSRNGWRADEFVLAALIKASDDERICAQLHAKAIRVGVTLERGVRTSLVARYSANGLLGDARKIFDEMSVRTEVDVPTWNAIISAYAFHGLYSECLVLLSAMLGTALLVATDATFAIAISACSASREFRVGKAIHAMVLKNENVSATRIHNSLISMYSKWGLLKEAMKIFERMNFRDAVSWNAMISGLEQNGECEEAVAMFRRWTILTDGAGVKPNSVTFLCVLSAVATIVALNFGKEIHCQLIRLGLDGETSIGNSLITMYGKCGETVKARLVFEKLCVRDVISWNSMLSGYVQNNKMKEGYQLLKQMQLSGTLLDLHTLTIFLCGLPTDLLLSNCCKQGKEIHGYLLKTFAWKALHPYVLNAVITMYSKGNKLTDAKKVFQGMIVHDSYSWNAMIDAYSMNECCNDAIMIFVEMLRQGFEPDHLTYSSTLTVCGKVASIEQGRQLHALAMKQCLYLSSFRTFLLSINNALISMYSRCGCVYDAAKVFQRMEKRDVFSWTSMITGYSLHGLASEALHLFNAMRSDGVMPNSVTFLGLLSACAHGGLVTEGSQIFSLIHKQMNIKLQIEHYAYMVDLFARSGQFEEAEAMIHTAIFDTGVKDSCLWLWKVLLGACHAHKKLDLGIRVASKILELDPDDETTHILLSNLYAAFGMWKDATGLRRAMRQRGLQKEVGCSWVEIRNRKHVFVAADNNHEKQKEIYERLEDLDRECRNIGYVPLTEWALHDVDEVQKETILGCHSERIALSFALLKPKKLNGVIRVFKNLRVCGDCHNWMKFVSMAEQVEIILRDSRRFHSFKEGKCSCGDYW